MNDHLLTSYEFRWATTNPWGWHSMPQVEELEYFGYRVIRRGGDVCGDARYGSVLMGRPA